MGLQGKGWGIENSCLRILLVPPNGYHSPLSSSHLLVISEHRMQKILVPMCLTGRRQAGDKREELSSQEALDFKNMSPVCRVFY